MASCPVCRPTGTQIDPGNSESCQPASSLHCQISLQQEELEHGALLAIGFWSNPTREKGLCCGAGRRFSGYYPV